MAWLTALRELIFPSSIVCSLCQQKNVSRGLPACNYCLAGLNLKISQLKLQRYQGFYLTNYDGLVKELLNDIKYQSNHQAGIVVGQILGLAAREIRELQSIDYILPVPLNYHRLQQRGYNQTEVFCKGFSQVWKKPIYQAMRKRNTLPQNDLSASERLKNLRDAFHLIEPHQIRAKQILIIDDIYTTGATFYSLADLIQQHHGKPIGLFLAKS